MSNLDRLKKNFFIKWNGLFLLKTEYNSCDFRECTRILNLFYEDLRKINSIRNFIKSSFEKDNFLSLSEKFNKKFNNINRYLIESIRLIFEGGGMSLIFKWNLFPSSTDVIEQQSFTDFINSYSMLNNCILNLKK